MLTNSKQKLIQSLQMKKFRNEHNLFVVEGLKIVSELILNSNFITEVLIGEKVILDSSVIEIAKSKNIEIIACDDKVLQKISSHTTPQNCIALAKIIKQEIDFGYIKNQKVIALDNIQDPGNLGTIFRSADWFGIKNIVCSTYTVDCYNPKVVQASMGSLCNVNIFYVDLNIFLKQAHDLKMNIYGTLLNGISIENISLSAAGVLLLGNEANGISEKNLPFITQAITIDKSETTFAESLNVAIATAICCSKWNTI